MNRWSLVCAVQLSPTLIRAPEREQVALIVAGIGYKSLEPNALNALKCSPAVYRVQPVGRQADLKVATIQP